MLGGWLRKVCSGAMPLVAHPPQCLSLVQCWRVSISQMKLLLPLVLSASYIPEHRRTRLLTHNGRRTFLHRQRVLRSTGHLWLWIWYLGRWESGAILQDLDVRRHPGDSSLLSRGTHIPETFALQGKCNRSIIEKKPEQKMANHCGQSGGRTQNQFR